MLRPSPNHGTQRLPNDDDDEYIVGKILKKIGVSVMAALICIFTQLPKVVQRTTKLNFFRDPMGL